LGSSGFVNRLTDYAGTSGCRFWEVRMECHRCEYGEAVKAGKYARTRFGRTPCAKCDLRESSMRTMAVDLDRPVYLPGVASDGTCEMIPCPEELEVTEAKLPVVVMQELVARLLELPQDLREVVCLRFSGLEYKEIARRQRITAAGAEARHERAMGLFPELRELFILKTARHNIRHSEADAGRHGPRPRTTTTPARTLSRSVRQRSAGQLEMDFSGTINEG